MGRLFTFVGGNDGPWRVTSSRAVVGDALPAATRVRLVAGHETANGSAWSLSGLTSNERYVTRPEKTSLVAAQPDLGRPPATCAALIPISKNDEWWSLTQDERRQVFEETSGHIRIGMDYLPAVARRLHHCRDLGWPEPFDFLTWFEFAPADAPAFDTLLARLRSTPEWHYVSREAEIRLERG
jgi:chlorite dismutase